jgi:serine/threonine-protein kinase
MAAEPRRPKEAAEAAESATLSADHGDLPGGAAKPAPGLGSLGDDLHGAARYTLHDEIGRGGGGSVVLGFDRKLGRRIAVKRPIAASGAARLEREALVMARLEHPAIVPVHDAGRAADGTPFYAMKLLSGPNLGERIARAGTFDARLGLLRIVSTVCDAIAYAHAQHVIHRDLKPSNVVVGEFGEIAVIDWGLAKLIGAGEPPGGRVAFAGDLTGHGTVMGTPAYMAPEQAAGEVVDPRADVYALGAMLYEVLTGVPPYGHIDRADQLASLAAGPPPSIESREPRVPADLAAIVGKAIARAPGDRYPSAVELAADLHRYEAGRLVAAHRYSRWARAGRWLRRQRFAVVTTVAALALGMAVVLAAGAARSAVIACTGARERLAGIWDPPRRVRVAARLASSRLPYARATADGVADRLDSYGDAWVAMHTEACRATRVDASQPEPVLALRMTCLERRRTELAALANQLERADDSVVEHAIQATAALAPVAECADTQGLAARADASQRPAIVDAPWQVRIADVKALYDVGRWRDGVAAAARLVDDADAHAGIAVRAEAWGWLGRLRSELGDAKLTEPTLETALRLASEARDDVAAVHVVAALIHALNQILGRHDQALLAADLGEAFVSRAGDDVLRAELLIERGDVLGDLVRLEEARTAYTEAIALLARHVPGDDIELGRAIVRLASNRSDAGAFDEAQALDQRALAIFQHQLGAEHPKIAQILSDLGKLASRTGHFVDALAYDRRALDIKERVFGARSTEVARTVNNIAIVMTKLARADEGADGFQRAYEIYRDQLGPDHELTISAMGNLAAARIVQGRFDDALELGQRVLAAKIKASGPDSATVAGAHEILGEALLDRGDAAGAEAHYRRAVTILGKALGVAHPRTLGAEAWLAEVLVAEARCAEARPELERIVQGVESKQGKDSVSLIDPLRLLARCEVDAGLPASAVTRAERAQAIGAALAANGAVDPAELASARFELARALWNAGGDRARAVALAASAEAGLVDPTSQRERQRVQAWRHTHVVAARAGDATD